MLVQKHIKLTRNCQNRHTMNRN